MREGKAGYSVIYMDILDIYIAGLDRILKLLKNYFFTLVPPLAKCFKGINFTSFIREAEKKSVFF